MMADQARSYNRAISVVFLKTNEAFGGLSNMAGGFPLEVNETRILTAEALYQACRFPHRPEVQQLIIEQASPMTAKMKSKPYRRESRPDWGKVRVKIMRWCLRVKLAQNRDSFGKLLLETGERQIVEESRKDDFWGAKPIDEETLVGMNVLGRLLMELREDVKAGDASMFTRVEPLPISDFLLNSQPIRPVAGSGSQEEQTIRTSEQQVTPGEPTSRAVQGSLFDQHFHGGPRRSEK
jgi:type I restriction enzyme S subunit